MLIVLAVVSVSIAVWARWLVRANRAPRAVRWIGWGVVASSMTLGALAWSRLREVTAIADGLAPAARQAYLSSEVRIVMVELAVASGLALVAAIALGYFTLSTTPRAA